jgi:hypothetical protein
VLKEIARFERQCREMLKSDADQSERGRSSMKRRSS